uniref:DUF7869 domain-containing protein n=1 Tax=Phytophthora ramorum TaxID=164328 RepID=H3GFH0_PHYRM
MEELAAFAAAGGDQTASSSSGYSSDGSADSSWEPDPDDASSAGNEDEREEDQGGGEDMDTSIILIDCDLTSEVTRLIREDVCKKRRRIQSSAIVAPVYGISITTTFLSSGMSVVRLVTRFRNRINDGIFSVKAHGNRLNQNASAVDPRWLISWFKDFAKSVGEVVPIRVRKQSTVDGVVKLQYSSADYTLLPAYFTWGQLYMEMHNYVEEIRLRLGKGTDEVNSLLHHFIHKIALPGGHRKLTIYADNCGGQNKNNYVLKALLALAHMGDLGTVELKFFVKGHTEKAVDRGFGHVRKRLSRVDVWTMDHLLEVVNDASATSALVHVPNKNNTFREYREVVKEAYKDLKDIQKFQIFVMKSDSPGVVACQRGPRSSPVLQDLRRKYDGIVADADRVRVLFTSHLELLPNPPPNSEKIQQLYNTVRPYVPEEFVNDALYVPPNDEDERKANEIKRARAAHQKASAKRKKLEREAATKRDPPSEAAVNSAGNEAEAMQTEQQPAEGDRSGPDEASMAKEPSHVKKRPRKETS